MKLILTSIICFLFFSGILRAAEDPIMIFMHFEGDSTQEMTDNSHSQTTSFFEGRKGTALLYSLLVPGSGQTMLGSPYKGSGFAVLAFGSALTTLISQNNFVASNERLDALEYQYSTSTSWETSDAIYRLLKETNEKRNRYQKMRNTFAYISTAIWVLNIADVLFYTEDKGEAIFSMIQLQQTAVVLAGNYTDTQSQLTLTVPF